MGPAAEEVTLDVKRPISVLILAFSRSPLKMTTPAPPFSVPAVAGPPVYTVTSAVGSWLSVSSSVLPPPHTDAFFMRCVAIRHDASLHIRGRIVTKRTGTDEKRIRVGRAFVSPRADVSIFKYLFRRLRL